MKISEDTISILNNFSSINAALLFNEGSDIFTISEAKNILAKASVDETFPREFGIYQLSEFLSAVSLLDNPDFDFNAESVKVKAGNSRQTIKYSYTDPSLITSPPIKGNIDFPEPDVQFVLDKEDLKIFKQNLDSLFEILGKTEKTSIPSENLARKNARRSLVAKRYIPAGKKIDLEDITWKRPASGISPREIDKIMGSTAAKDILEDNILQWSDIID